MFSRNVVQAKPLEKNINFYRGETTLSSNWMRTKKMFINFQSDGPYWKKKKKKPQTNKRPTPSIWRRTEEESKIQDNNEEN